MSFFDAAAKMAKLAKKRASEAVETVGEKLKETWDENALAAMIADPLEHPEDEGVVTLDMPGYRQTQSYTCGYVAGMVVLHYFKPRASEDRFWDRCDPDTHGFVSETRLAAALRASGIRVGTRSRFSFSDIKTAIDAGKPIITTVEEGAHWFVIYGYRARPQKVFVANGSPRQLALAQDKEWSWAELVREQGDIRGGLICSSR
jgi:hypothetical protein